jgi:DNA modification methylase
LEYADFIKGKAFVDVPTGIESGHWHADAEMPFQRDIITWAIRRGRAAIFADCGMGKTLMQLAWARNVPGDVLILAPLAVSAQTVREGEKFGIEVHRAEDQSQVGPGITITNYDRMHRFDLSQFKGLVLDESSILKSYDGAFRNAIIEGSRQIPFRLACTATPAPNDYMELGNHAEFLGAMKRTEMLSTFFVHDGGDTSKWRLKGHAVNEFWRWVCSWAVNIRKPSDIGHDDAGFVLPPIDYRMHVVNAHDPFATGQLFAIGGLDLQARIRARRNTVSERAEECARLVNESSGPFLVWCNLNSESDQLARMIPGAVEVRGSDSPEHKERAMAGFSSGEIRVLITKPSIAGFGMNWQHCNQIAFVGLTDSYEQVYQATRRCWRFGQKSPVSCHFIVSDLELDVAENIKRKEADAARMADEMIRHMAIYQNVKQTRMMRMDFKTEVATGQDWTALLGDCVESIKSVADNSVGYSIFSPPFSSLYTYSNSERDMGNCSGTDEFMAHFGYLVSELFRVLKPGRNVSIHCFNIPAMYSRDGFIGVKDFRGDLIRAFQRAGFIYHSEVCIWKDPVVAMQRTKAIGLLYKQLKKDSCMSRMGIPDYLVTMKKPGENADPVEHTPDDLPVSEWQRIASPIWMDINPSDTLQYRSARENEDERHICPLQLEVIRRGMRLCSREGDLVLSPFMGIGSEGWVALQMGRKFIGMELKRSYYDQACKNLAVAAKSGNLPLFEDAANS